MSNTMKDSLGQLIYIGDVLQSIDTDETRRKIKLIGIVEGVGKFVWVDEGSKYFHMAQKALDNSKWVRSN